MFYGLDLVHIASNQDRRHPPRQTASRRQELSQENQLPQIAIEAIDGGRLLHIPHIWRSPSLCHVPTLY
jgi:hypothetical protein